MADDIDDLLEEVEKKFVGKKKPANEPKSKTKPVRRNQLDDDINDILSATQLDEELDHRKGSTPSTPARDESKITLGSDTGKKCYPVYMGGSAHQPGLGTSISQRVCDRLRCTACDFKICMFDNFKWASDTNYLFLRNNVPDFGKLKAKLSAAKGSRAYCCQCCWRTVKDLVQLNDPELKWVCGKH